MNTTQAPYQFTLDGLAPACDRDATPDRWDSFLDPKPEPLIESWRRSAETHGVNRESPSAPHILTGGELRRARDPLGGILRSAKAGLDQLYARVRPAGYVVLFCDTNGIAVDHRGDDAQEAEFRYWGTWLGGVWSEEAEGTNGIGTCIAAACPLTVHRTQHFRLRNGALSCSAAPVRNPDGCVAAALDVSSVSPVLSERAHGLTLPLVTESARALEERLFRARFARNWILAIEPSSNAHASPLLAIDGDHCIIGASHTARLEFKITPLQLEHGLSLWTLFVRTTALLRVWQASVDAAAALTDIGSGSRRTATVSAPVRRSSCPAGLLDNNPETRPSRATLKEFRRSSAVARPCTAGETRVKSAARRPMLTAATAADGHRVLLSRRERIVLRSIAEGFDAAQVAEKLHISIHTVRSHIKSIYRKRGIRSRVEAVVEAQRLGLFEVVWDGQTNAVAERNGF